VNEPDGAEAYYSFLKKFILKSFFYNVNGTAYDSLALIYQIDKGE